MLIEIDYYVPYFIYTYSFLQNKRNYILKCTMTYFGILSSINHSLGWFEKRPQVQ